MPPVNSSPVRFCVQCPGSGDPMTCDIVIRSYWKDLDWLRLAIASIHRFCTGFRQVVIIFPSSTKPWLKRSDLPAGVRICFCRDYADDYLGQQVTKLHADEFTDADYICHIDSDCIFCRDTSPQKLIRDAKPVVIMEPIALLGRHYPWRRPTEKFLGCTVLDDFMRQPPFTFPRRLYSAIRQYAVRQHGVDIETWVMAQPPRGFSEYNALGAFAWENYFHDFVWIDAAAGTAPEQHCRWYWSWGGLDRATAQEIRALLL